MGPSWKGGGREREAEGEGEAGELALCAERLVTTTEERPRKKQNNSYLGQGMGGNFQGIGDAR